MTHHDDLFDALNGFFHQCTSTGDADAVDHYVELELSLSQVRAIYALSQAIEPLPINALAERIGLSVAAAGRIVDLLVTAGMVARDESPADRRVKLVTVTASGRAAVAAHIDARDTAMRAQIARLSDSQVQHLTEALQPLLNAHPSEQENPA